MNAQRNGKMQAPSGDRQVFLIWGGDGWIAGILYEMLMYQGREVYKTTVRMEDRASVLRELDQTKPTHVLNCAGVTGRPNVEWCEDHKEETVRSNVIGTLNLADCCWMRGVHCTVFATGCKLIIFPSVLLVTKVIPHTRPRSVSG